MMCYLRSGTFALALCASIAAATAQTGPSSPGDRSIPPLNPGRTTSQETELRLTDAQKSAIFRAVHKEKAKVKVPPNLTASVGEQVPPSIELYMLPDDAVADTPSAKLYRYTLIKNDVVLVDPTTMRVVDVIRQ
jgi:hypothetical protein